jgi:hypothetical protein
MKKMIDMHPVELSDRQSIRTSFRFTKEADEALGWLSRRYGVPMKEILHSVIEQLIKGSHSHDELSEALGIGIILSEPNSNMNVGEGFQKTLKKTVVVTRGTLRNLKKLSEEYKIPRDEIINNAIKCAKEFTAIHDKHLIVAYQEAFELLDNFYNEAQYAELKLKDILGNEEDDPIIESMGLAVTSVMNTIIEIEDQIKIRTKK